MCKKQQALGKLHLITGFLLKKNKKIKHFAVWQPRLNIFPESIDVFLCVKLATAGKFRWEESQTKKNNKNWLSRCGLTSV